ncbi:response regulator [Halosegnis longus]|uniref:response regulator n=1 Tax=Halosegnis longus TaxID=2216012 RepID=UPI00296E7377
MDDEPDFADMTATFLEREHSQMTVRTTTNPEEGRRIVADADIDCIVSDYDMPHATGIEFLETIRDTYPDLPFILYTGKGSEEVAADAISAGVTDYLQKDTGNDQYKILANRIKNAVTARRSAVEAEQSRYRLEQILKTVPSCVVQLNYDGEFVFANDRAVEVLGLERSDLTSRAYNDPNGRSETSTASRFRTTSSRSDRCEIQVIHCTGSDTPSSGPTARRKSCS